MTVPVSSPEQTHPPDGDILTTVTFPLCSVNEQSLIDGSLRFLSTTVRPFPYAIQSLLPEPRLRAKPREVIGKGAKVDTSS